ncbi:MAG: glycosyltransferase family 9 protein [Nonlabens sp.]
MSLPKRLLIYRLSAMGDVAMVVPVVIALTRAYPQVEVILLSRKMFEPLFAVIPNVNFIVADFNGKHKGLLGLIKLSKELRALELNAVADFHDVLRTKVLRNLTTGVEISVIDKGRAEKTRLIKDPNFFQPLQHSTERYADVLRKLGYTIELNKDEFLSRKKLLESVIKRIGKKETKWIGFAPFAAHETKSLTVNRAKQIVKRIAKEFDVKIILIGGGTEEKKKLALVAGTISNVYNIVGQFSFEEELSLISNLDAMIAMDSGNGHLAALYDVPVITLWGNTHPYAGFAPYAQLEENQLSVNRKDFPKAPTSIFGNKIVKDYKNATDSIQDEPILDRLRKIMQ